MNSRRTLSGGGRGGRTSPGVDASRTAWPTPGRHRAGGAPDQGRPASSRPPRARNGCVARGIVLTVRGRWVPGHRARWPAAGRPPRRPPRQVDGFTGSGGRPRDDVDQGPEAQDPANTSPSWSIRAPGGCQAATRSPTASAADQLPSSRVVCTASTARAGQQRREGDDELSRATTTSSIGPPPDGGSRTTGGLAAMTAPGQVGRARPASGG